MTVFNLKKKKWDPTEWDLTEWAPQWDQHGTRVF